MGRMKARMVLRPQHSVPLMPVGTPCYMTSNGQTIAWEAIFQIHVELDRDDARVPLVHQSVKRLNIGVGNDGEPCIIEEWNFREYFSIGDKGWTALDYHFASWRWSLTCPGTCRWSSITTVSGNVVLAEPVRGRKWEGRKAGGGVPGDYHAASISANARVNTPGGWQSAQPPAHQTQADDPARAPVHGPPVPKYGSYVYAYSAQVSHCTGASGAIVKTPSGSPADVVVTSDLDLLLLSAGTLMPLNPRELPLSRSGSDPVGPMEIDGIGTNSQVSLAPLGGERLPTAGIMPPGLEALAQLYEELRSGEAPPFAVDPLLDLDGG